MPKQPVPEKQSTAQRQPKKPTPQQASQNQAVEDKKRKERRIVKKIEDFNKFTRIRVVKETKRRKQLADILTFEVLELAKAIKALQAFKKKQSEQSRLLLDEEDEFLYVEVTLNRLPEEYSIRPYQIKLPVPIYSEAYFSKHCIFVKDDEEVFKERIQDLAIPCIGEVIGYPRLVKEYNTYEEKRKLCKNFDLFFCDYRIYDLMRKPTGKIFYDRKKIPFPIDCEKVPLFVKEENYEAYLNSLSTYTYFIQGNGPNYSLKVGRITMDIKDLIKNVQAAVPALVAHLLESGALENESIRRVALKTAASPSLPVLSFITERERNLLADAIQEAESL